MRGANGLTRGISHGRGRGAFDPGICSPYEEGYEGGEIRHVHSDGQRDSFLVSPDSCLLAKIPHFPSYPPPSLPQGRLINRLIPLIANYEVRKLLLAQVSQLIKPKG